MLHNCGYLSPFLPKMLPKVHQIDLKDSSSYFFQCLSFKAICWVMGEKVEKSYKKMPFEEVFMTHHIFFPQKVVVLCTKHPFSCRNKAKRSAKQQRPGAYLFLSRRSDIAKRLPPEHPELHWSVVNSGGPL